MSLTRLPASVQNFSSFSGAPEGASCFVQVSNLPFSTKDFSSHCNTMDGATCPVTANNLPASVTDLVLNRPDFAHYGDVSKLPKAEAIAILNKYRADFKSIGNKMRKICQLDPLKDDNRNEMAKVINTFNLIQGDMVKLALAHQLNIYEDESILPPKQVSAASDRPSRDNGSTGQGDPISVSVNPAVLTEGDSMDVD